MGIFDKLKNTTVNAVNAAVQSAGNERVPFTYFAGSTPENNYTPTEPYSITVKSNHVSAEEAGYEAFHSVRGSGLAASYKAPSARQRRKVVFVGAVPADRCENAEIG